MQKVGFIGLGLMGGPMAANVVRAGLPLTVYNRTADKAEPLKKLGAAVAASPKEVAQNSETIITMLSDATAVETVLKGDDGVLAGAAAGLVLIDMSTVAPDQSQAIGAMLAEHDIKMLDAPVGGSTGPATEGTLSIVVGGDEAVFEAQKELLGVMGKDVFYLGPQGSGATMKMAFNLIVAAQMMSLAEAMLLAIKGGVSARVAGEILAGRNFSSGLIRRKVQNIVNADYTPAFPLKHMQKDLGLMVRTGDRLGVTLPATSATHQIFTAAKTRGHEDEDFAAVFSLLAEMAGLE
jgi:3-hydroxyisobutyrate dehydrogenase-like beta-hydroxyacid dehydrogenase